MPPSPRAGEAADRAACAGREGPGEGPVAPARPQRSVARDESANAWPPAWPEPGQCVGDVTPPREERERERLTIMNTKNSGVAAAGVQAMPAPCGRLRAEAVLPRRSGPAGGRPTRPGRSPAAGWPPPTPLPSPRTPIPPGGLAGPPPPWRLPSSPPPFVRRTFQSGFGGGAQAQRAPGTLRPHSAPTRPDVCHPG